jgi:hypothetical protein
MVDWFPTIVKLANITISENLMSKLDGVDQTSSFLKKDAKPGKVKTKFNELTSEKFQCFWLIIFFVSARGGESLGKWP